MAALADAVAGQGDVFLCDPNWGEHERAQVARLSALSSQRSAQSTEGWLLIPTGGTSGILKFARHDEETLSAAVRGFTRHFGLRQVNAMGVLPLHHVSGLMAWLRCALTGGEFRPLDWKAVEGGGFPALPSKPEGWTLSLVPTQLERLLNGGGGPSSSWAAVQRELDPPKGSTVAWLRQFRVIFLGGAPAWPALLDQAAGEQLPLSLGYGMTETAAMVTAQRPAEFLAGDRSNGTPLPHATVRLEADDRIVIGGPSLFRGYYPGRREAGEFATQDRGRLDGTSRLHVLGRIDAVIITGGEKVDPAELEALLRETGQFPEIVVLGVPDARWGQQVVAVYPGHAQPNLHQVIAATNRLADYKRPKRFMPLVGPWPANAQGKVNRAELLERVIAQMKERR
jgi:O-succinylbenzoic acid--CoA ligase